MTDPTEKFELSDAEKLSPLWQRLKDHLTSELQSARKRNDSERLSEQETAALRGGIAKLKSFISLGDDRPLTD